MFKLNDGFVSSFVAFRKQQQMPHNVYKILVRSKAIKGTRIII